MLSLDEKKTFPVFKSGVRAIGHSALTSETSVSLLYELPSLLLGVPINVETVPSAFISLMV